MQPQAKVTSSHQELHLALGGPQRVPTPTNLDFGPVEQISDSASRAVGIHSAVSSRWVCHDSRTGQASSEKLNQQDG